MDYYKILGLSTSATLAQIKKAFRQLAIEFHPDKNPKNPAAEDKFQRISEAYAVLSNPEKRAEYDRSDSASQNRTEPRSPKRSHQSAPRTKPASQPTNESPTSTVRAKTKGKFSGASFSDFFSDFFTESEGQETKIKRPLRGESVQQILEIDLKDVLQGGKFIVPVTIQEVCIRCNGVGRQGAIDSRGCRRCAGTGTIEVRMGNIDVKRICPSCCDNIDDKGIPCFNCSETGRIERQRKIMATVKPGVKDGTRLKILGKGEPGVYGGPNGDLFLKVRIREHPYLSRHGNDLHSEVEVDFIDAILGKQISVQTLDNFVCIDIPAGTQPNREFKLSGKGLPNEEGTDNGDQLVTLRIKLPTEISPYQLKLLQKFYLDSS